MNSSTHKVILTLCALCLPSEALAEEGGQPLAASAHAAGPWTLDHALAHVAEDAPDARMAALRFEEARSRLAEARAQWLPKLTAETGYAATDNPSQAFMFLLNQRQLTFGGNFNEPAVTDNWGSELRLEYPLYTGGARKAGERAALNGAEALEHDLFAVRRQLQLEVARLYFHILRAREVVKAAEASLASQNANLKLARELVDGGKALLTAVLDLETQVARAETDVAAAANQRDVATAMLKALLGLENEAPFAVSDRWISLRWPGDPITVPSRAEIMALQKREEQADARIDAAKASRRPTVAAFASTRHDEGFTEADGGNSWIAGFMVRMKLFDGGETSAQVAQAEAGKAIVAEQLRKQNNLIDLQIKTAQLNLTTARKRITSSEKAVKSAQESLDLTRKRFQEGVALTTQLIDAESALTGSRVALSGARAEEQIALAELRHALGLPIRDTGTDSK